jgi:hypothetical protein
MGRHVWTEMRVVARSAPSIDDEPVLAFTRAPHAEPAAQASPYRIGMQRPAMKAEGGAVLYVLGKTTFTCASRTPGW